MGPDKRFALRAFACLVAAGIETAALNPANATDEIQVYNAGIAAVGQFTIEQHLNYIASGQKTPPFPGGLVSNHSLNGTPEFAYGVTDWWELGLYLPFSVQDQRFYSDAVKVRTLFVVPHADQRKFFYGINFEFANETPPFSQARFSMEVRPIVGVRNDGYEFIVNPIVDVHFGKYAEQHFTPAARVATKLGEDLWGGFEYYADLGQIGSIGKFSQQQHTLFAVTDFKAGVFDVNFGIGCGLTPSSDHLVFKTVIGYAFPVPGDKSKAGGLETAGPVNPMARSSFRMFQP